MTFFDQQVVPLGGGYDRLAITYGDEGHVVEYAALIQIRKHLEEECERQEQVWAQRDQTYADSLDIPFQPISIERPLAHNYFIGARPSLIMSSVDLWPSITSYSGPRRPAGEQFDQIDVLDIELFIEVLCKYGPIKQELLQQRQGIEAEGLVNKQTQRLSAAVHMCVKRDPTLGGVVQTIQRPPHKQPSKPFAQAGSNSERAGDYYLYMGMQLRYVVQMNSY